MISALKISEVKKDSVQVTISGLNWLTMAWNWSSLSWAFMERAFKLRTLRVAFRSLWLLVFWSADETEYRLVVSDKVLKLLWYANDARLVSSTETEWFGALHVKQTQEKSGFSLWKTLESSPISWHTGWYHCEQLSYMMPVSVISNPHAPHWANSDPTEDMMINPIQDRTITNIIKILPIVFMAKQNIRSSRSHRA